MATGGFLKPISALGASGAIFALMGALFAMRRALGINLQQLVIVLAINLAIGFLVPNIAWQAHLGGLVAGFALGVVFLRHAAARRPGRSRSSGWSASRPGSSSLMAAFVLDAAGQYF